MTNMTTYLAAAAAIGGLAAPALAQQPYPYPQTYPQTYPQQYTQPYQGYGYNQGYAQNPIEQIIGSLLGNRYNVTDRTAISQCASAAMAQAQAQYRGYDYGQQANGYGHHGDGYNQGFAAPSFRVTAITDVQRRSLGLRVKGLLSSGYAGAYAGQYGYNQNRNYAQGDLSFRCNVDYRGAVTNIKISRNAAYRRY